MKYTITFAAPGLIETTRTHHADSEAALWEFLDFIHTPTYRLISVSSHASTARPKSQSCLDPQLADHCTWPKCTMTASGWRSCVPERPTDHTMLSDPNE